MCHDVDGREAACRDQPLGTAIDWQSQCLTLRVDQGRFIRGTFYMPHRWQSLPVPPQPEDARQPASGSFTS